MKLSLTLKIVLSAVVYIAVVQALHMVLTVATMNYYTDSAYFSVWSKIMMPEAGSPPTSFFVYSIAISFVIGVIFAKVYSKVHKIFTQKSYVQKGLRYGIGLILVSSVPFSLAMFLLINLPLCRNKY